MNPTTKTSAARLEMLDEVIAFAEECADRFGLDIKEKFRLRLSVEEAFVNICHYAYSGGEGTVELSCGGKDNAFVIEIADSGGAFNILTLPDPDTTADIMDRDIGGLGVFFIRKLTDDLSYRRENGRNILRMVLHPSNEETRS
ncbi:MAG: ATP-binding protein [Desulfobulbus sp.]|nr:ATP-binding protein [Desulfobulbus sp.]